MSPPNYYSWCIAGKRLEQLVGAKLQLWRDIDLPCRVALEKPRFLPEPYTTVEAVIPRVELANETTLEELDGLFTILGLAL
jgi:hypothetical protein